VQPVTLTACSQPPLSQPVSQSDRVQSAPLTACSQSARPYPVSPTGCSQPPRKTSRGIPPPSRAFPNGILLAASCKGPVRSTGTALSPRTFKSDTANRSVAPGIKPQVLRNFILFLMKKMRSCPLYRFQCFYGLIRILTVWPLYYTFL
jgi:hypothetical protein